MTAAPAPPRPPGPLFHVVLHQPEIPNNTGNAGRTCVALASRLHLIHPLGFDTSEHACRRAGLDYWKRVDAREHPDWPAYLASEKPPALWLLTTRAATPLWDATLRPGDHFVFGAETRGLPDDLLAAHPNRCLTLPMAPAERSLNLATAVCAVLYEALRQAAAREDVRIVDGRIWWNSATLALPPANHRPAEAY